MKTMKEMISVIMPVYNVEDIIERSVRSVLLQSYKNIELILIDDGSTDKSGFICDQLAKSDSRISVIHKNNGGAADARNIGVASANGEYIGFVDSDDFLDREYFEILMRNLLKEDADISACRYIKYSTELPHFIKNGKYTVFDGVEACVALMTNCNFLVPPWGKIIKRNLVLQAPFPVGRVDEDEATIHQYLYYSKKVVISDDKLYGYFTNPNGVMSKNQNKHALDLWKSLHERKVFFYQLHENKLYKIALCQYTRASFDACERGVLPQNENIKQIARENILNRNEKITVRLFCLLVFIFGEKALKMKYHSS